MTTTKTEVPEVIVKQQFTIDATGDEPYAVPEILILGNREGLRQFAQWLLNFVERKATPHPSDPDDHQHLPTKYPPFSQRLSDEIEFRIGKLTESNRDEVLAKYGISESTRQAGDLSNRYHKQAEDASQSVEHTRSILKS